MKRKKNKFITYFLSFIPGVAYLYMGFMKLGLSYIVLFFTSFYFVSWLDIEIFQALIPIIWFYGFFDQINTFSLSEIEFQEVKDHYLFEANMRQNTIREFLQKHNVVAPVAIILFGSYLLMNSFYTILLSFVPSLLIVLIETIQILLPQIIVSFVIIYWGFSILQKDKTSVEKNSLKEKAVQVVDHTNDPILEVARVPQENFVYYMEKSFETMEEKENQLKEDIKEEQEVPSV